MRESYVKVHSFLLRVKSVWEIRASLPLRASDGDIFGDILGIILGIILSIILSITLGITP